MNDFFLYRFTSAYAISANRLVDWLLHGNVLHHGLPWALLDRRFPCVLRHLSAVPLLSLYGRQWRRHRTRRLRTTGSVPLDTAARLFRIVDRWFRPEWVRVASARDRRQRSTSVFVDLFVRWKTFEFAFFERLKLFSCRSPYHWPCAYDISESEQTRAWRLLARRISHAVVRLFVLLHF